MNVFTLIVDKFLNFKATFGNSPICHGFRWSVRQDSDLRPSAPKELKPINELNRSKKFK